MNPIPCWAMDKARVLVLGLTLFWGPLCWGFDAASGAQHACRPDFPLQDGWLGGDGVYSIPLSDTDSLWLFGDSFIGDGTADTRKDAALISNSLALSRCIEGEWTISYHWKKNDGAPAAYFVPPDAVKSADGHKSVRYWPLDGIYHEGVLTLFLMRVETVDPTSPLGFAITGTDLVRIGNPTAPPRTWHMRIHPLARVPALTGSGILRRDNHLLLMTPLEGRDYPDHPVILTRLPLDQLDDAAPAIETLMPDGAWRAGIAAGTGARVIPQAASEMSVDIDPRGDGFVAVHMDPTPFSSRIMLRRAPVLEGPWSDMVPLFSVGDAGHDHDDGVFCYAGKAHEQFRKPGGEALLVTYACNALRFEALLDDLGLYIPHTAPVLVPLR